VATETHEDFSEPILPGKGASDYERYLRTDDLLALQKTPEEQSHPDELLFQTVHQSSELWLKLAWFEVETAIRYLRERKLAAAIRLLRRATDAVKTTIGLLDMLEHMSPWEYTRGIRPVLGHGSGFDSPGWNGVRRVSGSRAPSQRPHSSAAKARSLGKDEGGLWRRVIAGEKPASIAGRGTRSPIRRRRAAPHR